MSRETMIVGSRRKGFALVIALTIMALLVLVILTIAGFLNIESRLAVINLDYSRTRLNALMSARLALGQAAFVVGNGRARTNPPLPGKSGSPVPRGAHGPAHTFSIPPDSPVSRDCRRNSPSRRPPRNGVVSPSQRGLSRSRAKRKGYFLCYPLVQAPQLQFFC